MGSDHACLEILSVNLLDEERQRVDELRHLAGTLGLEFGWHYLLDLTWVLRHLGTIRGQRIMDAGAGTGIIQWYLAQQGATVYSVDRLDRSALPLRLRAHARVRGLRPADMLSSSAVMERERTTLAGGARSRRFFRNVQSILRGMLPRREGEVILYNEDLAHLSELQDNSIDTIVSISSLEHNTPEGLEGVVTEMLRVLKPGGRIIATLCTAGQTDWFHEPSKGMCYSAATLKRIFQLPADLADNYGDYERQMGELRTCAELRDNLAMFYSRSGNNGMPWGKWDPQYQPVGVIKTKA
ncbi:MAG: class I SAM-dependent methyltransferase [Anaerolineae bacterium]|nr:MAG: class I SAM-dependent methyltransferase [Anaerolineae bacterium]